MRLLFAALKDCGERIGRSVNPTVYPAKEFAKKLGSGQRFLTTVMREKRLYLIGDEDKLAETSGKDVAIDLQCHTVGL